MAKKLHVTKPQIGDLCYWPHSIMKPGKIIAISEVLIDNTYDVQVKWLDGSVDDANTLYLNDFNHATDEHLKKYGTLDAIRQRLKKL